MINTQLSSDFESGAHEGRGFARDALHDDHVQVAFQGGSQRVWVSTVVKHKDERRGGGRCHQSGKGGIDVCVGKEGDLDSSRQLHGLDAFEGTEDGVVVLCMKEGGRVESELFGNTRADACVLPQSGTLDVPAGAAGSAFRAGLLQHATAEAGALLAHSLNFLASLFSESAAHLVLVGALQQTETAMVDGECWL